MLLVALIVGLEWSDTVNAGGLITILISSAALIGVILTTPKRAENTNLQRQLNESRAENGDLRRRLSDLGAEKDTEAKLRAAADERSRVLQERLEMLPDWPAVQDWAGALLEHVDEKAAERQEGIVEAFGRVMNEHEEKAAGWYQNVIDSQTALAESTRELVREVRDGLSA